MQFVDAVAAPPPVDFFNVFAFLVAGMSAAKLQDMKIWVQKKLEEGKVGWVLLWLLGVPIPILLILFLLRGCT